MDFIGLCWVVVLIGVSNANAGSVNRSARKVINYCPPVQFTLRHGIIYTYDKYPRALGSRIYFSCHNKYKLVGRNEIVCTKKGWSRKRPPRCKVRRCPNPGQPENGRRFGNNFTVDAVVIFYCNSGFRRFGSQKRICQVDGSWSGNLTTCDDGKTHCPNPGVPVGSTKNGNRYNMGSIVEYSCKRGFTLKGSKKRRCRVNGAWTGVTPTCIDNSIPPISVVSKKLKDNFANPLMSSTCSSRNANCTRDARGRALQRSYRGGLDLVFLLDASSSVTGRYFKLGLEFIKEMVRMFGVDHGPDGTRIACVSFGTKSHLEFGFGAASVSSTAEAIVRISKIKYKGGGTATRQALDLVRKEVMALARKDSKKALMFITDGNSNIGGKPASAARKLKRKGVEIYVIGVGKKVKMEELRSIASSPYGVHVFRIEQYSDIEDLKDSITDFSECGLDQPNPRSRIVGGKYSRAGKWPWALLMHGPNGVCGATLLDKNWVLTAAHCIVPDSPGQLKEASFSPTNFQVALGLNHLGKDEKQRVIVDVENTFVHHNYIGEPVLKNDIGLLKLAKHPRFEHYNKYIQRLCLPDKKNFNVLDKLGSGGIVVGWGSTKKSSLFEKKDDSLAESLKEVFLPFVKYRICKNRTVVLGRKKQGWFFDKRTMFCAGSGKGVNDTCSGDSGGPFMVKRFDKDIGGHRWYQVGITSWGVGCATKNEYAYLTRVTEYLDWIKKTIKKNSS